LLSVSNHLKEVLDWGATPAKNEREYLGEKKEGLGWLDSQTPTRKKTDVETRKKRYLPCRRS